MCWSVSGFERVGELEPIQIRNVSLDIHHTNLSDLIRISDVLLEVFRVIGIGHLLSHFQTSIKI